MKRKTLLTLLFIFISTQAFAGNTAVIVRQDPKVPECGLPDHTSDPSILVRPNRPTYTGTEYFRIKTHVRVHYARSYSDSTTLAYAESVAVYAESCWVRAAALGWAVPPPDQGIGGDDLFDIYLRHHVNIGAYGVCYHDSNYTDPYPDGYSSWIEVCTDSVHHPFPRYMRLKALTAHEFHHSCQYRYSRWEQPYWWYYENTSSWIEDILFPGCGTLLWRNSRNTDYTDNPLTRSWWEINTTYSNFEYPGGLWPKFQAEYYGPDTPRLIWTLCGQHPGSHCLVDTDSALKLNYNGSLANAIGHYAIWRYFTGGRDDNLHFFRAESCTTAILHARHTTYPASGDQGGRPIYGPGGMDMIEFVTDGNQNLTLSFDGEDGYNWRAYVVATRGLVSYEHLMLLDANAAGSIVIPAWEVDTAVLIPVCADWINDTIMIPSLAFTYSAGVTLCHDITEKSYADPLFYAASQNPVSAERILIHYALPASENGDLKITDVAGRVVRNTKLRGIGRPAIYVWDKRDRSGAVVEAGVYFYRLSAKNKTDQGKIIVVK